MILLLTLEKPVFGYWDGGAKSRFTYSVDFPPQRDKKGGFVRVGSWEANSWFCVAVGKTEKKTLANAKRHLILALKRWGLKYQFTYIE